MFYRCELLVGGYVYPVTEHIKNWDDITVSFKRNDYDGVVRSFTDKFEFVKGARQLLMDEYNRNYLNASANIVISTRNNSWTWTERFRCALNFSTLNDDGFVCTLNAIDDSVAALIKAKKGTEYEYSVNVVKDSTPLLYDGLEMTNSVVMSIPPNDVDSDKLAIGMEENGFYSLPLYVETSEIVRKGEIEVTDQMESFYNESDWIKEQPYFFKNKSKEHLLARLKMLMLVSCNSTSEDQNNRFEITGSAKGQIPLVYFSFEFPKNTSSFFHHIEVDIPIVLPPSYGIQMYFHSQYGKSSVLVSEIREKPSLTWMSRRDAVYMDVVKPQVLLNRLLKSINGGKEGLTGVIVPSGDKRLDNALILAAESARHMPGAKIYSSFEKFSKWMSSVFGYAYDINGKTVTFRPRTDYFTSEVAKVIEDYNNYSMKVNASLIYSQVNVGYEKQDYDSVNGKDEFRFTNIYNTDITLTDNKLELISPYRADAYGIEFLAQKIGEDTTDNESDNGVFFVCVQEDGDSYVLDRSMPISGVISPTTMFNAMYSPTSMIAANESYLGGFISDLRYASSEGNTSVIISGKAENRDISLAGGLFNVNEVEIETSDIEIPADMTGVVRFEHQGEMMEGYYKSTDYNYTKSKSAKITLIVKK
jgi:hypothetical protein